MLEVIDTNIEKFLALHGDFTVVFSSYVRGTFTFTGTLDNNPSSIVEATVTPTGNDIWDEEAYAGAEQDIRTRRWDRISVTVLNKVETEYRLEHE